jgi:hypothetical protein
MKVASGEFLCYIDADMVLGPCVLERSIEALARGVSGVYVPETILGTKLIARLRRFERGFYDATAIDAVRVFPTSSFIEVGGFDEVIFENGSGEDWDLDLSLKLVGELSSYPRQADVETMLSWPLRDWCLERGVDPQDAGSIYHNEADIQLRPYLAKKSYYARGFGGYIEKWGRENISIRAQFSMSYRLVGVFFEDGKWQVVLRHPAKYLGVLGLRIAVGFSYLRTRFGFR